MHVQPRTKPCERCGAAFWMPCGQYQQLPVLYCKNFTDQERDFIASRYGDCICAGCMAVMKNEYHKIQQDLQLQVFSGQVMFV